MKRSYDPASVQALLQRHVAMIGRRAEFRRAFLELDRVTPGQHGRVDQFLGDVDLAVVIDADFRDDARRLAFADAVVADLHRAALVRILRFAP